MTNKDVQTYFEYGLIAVGLYLVWQVFQGVSTAANAIGDTENAFDTGISNAVQGVKNLF